MEEIKEAETTVDGVRAIEIRYRPIYETDTKEPTFFQTRVRLNSPDSGVILPERFMPVLESSDRCVSVFKLALLQTVKAAEKFAERELDFNWISLFMPIRLLHKKDCAGILTEFTKQIGASPDRICLEIPPLVIGEDDGYCDESMKKLRKAGFHTMVCGIGADNFPLFRLSELEPEYVMLEEEAAAMLGRGNKAENCVRSLITTLNELGAEPIASGVSSSETADMLYDLRCSYYTADENSGERGASFVLERFVRRRNQD